MERAISQPRTDGSAEVVEGEADTQWPRWLVFKQDDARKPHQAVGSVHGVGAEHALLMARSVFARRPSAISLWVAPESMVYPATAEQLAAGLPQEGAEEIHASEETYHVFRKRGYRRAMTFVEHVGDVTALGERAAMLRAVERFGEPDAVAWWVVPASAVSASPDDEAAAWFDPGRDKDYKQQSAYGSTHAGAVRNEKVP